MSSWIHKREEDTGKISASKIGETHRQMQGVMAHQNRNSRVKKKNPGTSTWMGKHGL